MTNPIKRAILELFGKHEALLSRDDAIKFWRNQMDIAGEETKYRDHDDGPNYSTRYGNCELMQLMDAIYGITDRKIGKTEYEERQTEAKAKLQKDIKRWT